MNAKYLILSVVVTVWASAAVAAINYGRPEPVTTVRKEATAIPRVVVTARKIEAPVARIVIIGRRTTGGDALASN